MAWKISRCEWNLYAVNTTTRVGGKPVWQLLPRDVWHPTSCNATRPHGWGTSDRQTGRNRRNRGEDAREKKGLPSLRRCCASAGERSAVPAFYESSRHSCSCDTAPQRVTEHTLSLRDLLFFCQRISSKLHTCMERFFWQTTAVHNKNSNTLTSLHSSHALILCSTALIHYYDRKRISLLHHPHHIYIRQHIPVNISRLSLRAYTIHSISSPTFRSLSTYLLVIHALKKNVQFTIIHPAC